MLTQRERAAVEFIKSHLLELQSMARLAHQNVLSYLIEMAAMEAGELLGQHPQRNKDVNLVAEKGTE